MAVKTKLTYTRVFDESVLRRSRKKHFGTVHFSAIESGVEPSAQYGRCGMRSFDLPGPGICEKFDQTRFKTLATAVESGRDFIENEGLIERAQALGCRPRQASAVDLGDIPIDEENVIKHGLSLGSKAAFCASNKKPDRSMNSPEMKMLIRREFGKEIAIRTISTYMKRWNMTPQRPKTKALQQDPVAVSKWLEETYPQIEQRAKAENALILWQDETAVKQDSNWVRSYAPRGQTPILIDNARTNYGAPVMISAVNNQGKCFSLSLAAQGCQCLSLHPLSAPPDP